MDIEKDIDYIYKYIEYTFFSVDEYKNAEYLLTTAQKIKNNMVNSSFSSGKFDFYINNYVGQQLRKIESNSYEKYQCIKNHVYLVMNYYKIYHGINIENYERILTRIMRDIYTKYSYEEIIAGNADDEIETLIQDYLAFFSTKSEIIENEEYIYRYVLNLLEENKLIFDTIVPLNDLTKILCNQLRNKKIDDILSGEYNELIYSIIREKQLGITYTSEFELVNNAVKKYVSKNNTYISDKEVNIFKESFNLSMNLIKQGFSEKDIITGSCNNIMERHLRLDCIKQNSKASSTSKNKLPLSTKKAFIPIKNKALVLAIISAIGIGVITGNIENEKRVDYELIDQYEYPTIPYELSNEFVETLEHIEEQYNENTSIDKKYGQICLYKAFESVKSEKYQVMDSMLQLIEEKSKYDDTLIDLNEDIKDCETYVDYMYKNLLEQKPEVITNEISEAVTKYNSQFANYRELNAFRVLDKSDALQVDKLARIYGRYINDLENEMTLNRSK